jgi:hypothetical protein
MPKQLRGRLLDGRCDLGEDNVKEASPVGWHSIGGGDASSTREALLEKEPIGEGNLEGRSLGWEETLVESHRRGRVPPIFSKLY